MTSSKAYLHNMFVVALGLGALVVSSGAAMARDHLRSELSPVNDADAKGRVRVLVRSPSDGRLELTVRRLDPNNAYDVLVNGVKVGTLQTKSSGSGRIRFRSRPRGHDLTLGFDPRGSSIVLRNGAGADVLQGSIALGTTGGSDDSGKIICCIPDDHGSECEDRTADECTAQGGTASTATSCLPNPCDGAAPVEHAVVCCIPDDSGPECEDRSAEQCAAQGGIVVDATSCSPNPCAATPAAPTTRCCLPDDSGPECEDRTPEQCLAQGGTDIGAGVCAPDSCTSSGTPAPTPGVDDHGGNSGSSGGGHHGNDDAARATGTYY